MMKRTWQDGSDSRGGRRSATFRVDEELIPNRRGSLDLQVFIPRFVLDCSCSPWIRPKEEVAGAMVDGRVLMQGDVEGGFCS